MIYFFGLGAVVMLYEYMIHSVSHKNIIIQLFYVAIIYNYTYNIIMIF